VGALDLRQILLHTQQSGNGNTSTEIHQMLPEAFGDNALGQMQTYKWFKRFNNRCQLMMQSVMDDLQPEP